MADFDFEVVDLGPTDLPEPGTKAPDFTRPLVTDEYWEDRSLSEVLGGDHADSGDSIGDHADDSNQNTPLILVCYPMNGSFLARYIWDEIAERDWSDTASVVGLTISTPYDHKSFIRDRGLEVPLFSDPTNAVAKAYGIVHELDGMSGVSEPRPAVFVLESDRTVRYAWAATQWPDFPDYDAVEAALEGGRYEK